MPGRALIIDTETTGMFDWQKPADAEGQPRLLALSAIVVDPFMVNQMEYHTLVCPEGFEVDEEGEAFQVNGLSNEMLQSRGQPVADVLGRYNEMVDQCDFIAAFSVRFDQKILRAEARRADLPDRYGERRTFEIMYPARKIACRAAGPHSNPRKLTECYENVFGHPYEDPHEAENDLNATIELYRVLHGEGLVVPKEQKSKKGGAMV